MKPGVRRRVTLREVAKTAGVSRSAVSRAFTEGASVSPATRRKVMTAAKALGYRPNVLASSLTTRRTKLIGLVADNFANPIFLVIFDQFTRLLQDRGFRPLLVNLSDQTSPDASVEMLLQYSVDGVIVASSTLPASFAAAFRAAGLPVVHSFGRYAGEVQTPVVGVDNLYAGRLAARTLLDHGYRRLGFMGGPELSTSTLDRLRGFAEASPQGFACGFAGAYSYDAGHAEMRRLIAVGETADAWFCSDDLLAVGAMDALAEAGLRVPGDVGILGMDDMDMARWRCIGLSTIRQPFSQIIAASVDLVLSLIDAPENGPEIGPEIGPENGPEVGPETRLLPCQVILRDTLSRL